MRFYASHIFPLSAIGTLIIINGGNPLYIDFYLILIYNVSQSVYTMSL